MTTLDMTDPLDFFSKDYFDARERFCESAAATEAVLTRYPIDLDPSLSIDVACINSDGCPRRLIVSSGVHGVEGPLGSAIQLAALQMIRERKLPSELGYVFIHALNPYGYVRHRRWNEDNVDLNRNFPCASNTYSGCSAGYQMIEALLNPKSLPSRLEPFKLKAFWNIARHGFQAMKEAVATGQYEYPQGLFFGGRQECCSARIVRENFDQWIGDATEIVHLDVHTGLGRSGDYKLLLEYPSISPEVEWFRQMFDTRLIEDLNTNQTSYDARGTFGVWGSGHVTRSAYRFATVEVGTHPIVRVLGALRAENRVHHYAPENPQMQWAREELRECFCPASAKWRRNVIRDQTDVLRRCAHGLMKESMDSATASPVA